MCKVAYKMTHQNWKFHLFTVKPHPCKSSRLAPKVLRFSLLKIRAVRILFLEIVADGLNHKGRNPQIRCWLLSSAMMCCSTLKKITTCRESKKRNFHLKRSRLSDTYHTHPTVSWLTADGLTKCWKVKRSWRILRCPNLLHFLLASSFSEVRDNLLFLSELWRQSLFQLKLKTGLLLVCQRGYADRLYWTVDKLLYLEIAISLLVSQYIFSLVVVL